MGVNLKFGGGDSSKTTAIGKTKDGAKVNATGANVANGEVVNSESGVQNVADIVRLTDFIRSDFLQKPISHQAGGELCDRKRPPDKRNTCLTVSHKD